MTGINYDSEGAFPFLQSILKFREEKPEPLSVDVGVAYNRHCLLGQLLTVIMMWCPISSNCFM